jgi:MFS-type transporter involved in bile tolerance (Atg22 family)
MLFFGLKANHYLECNSPAAMRGRVISFYAMMFFGMQPLGGLLIGFISQKIGTPDTVLGEGIVALLIGVLDFYFLKKQKAMKAKQQPAVVETSLALQ